MRFRERIKQILNQYVDLSDLTDRPEPEIREDVTHLPPRPRANRPERKPADGSFEEVDSLEPNFEEMDAPVTIPYSFMPNQHKLKRVDGKWYIE
jgi:hypothetical protein